MFQLVTVKNRARAERSTSWALQPSDAYWCHLNTTLEWRMNSCADGLDEKPFDSSRMRGLYFSRSALTLSKVYEKRYCFLPVLKSHFLRLFFFQICVVLAVPTPTPTPTCQFRNADDITEGDLIVFFNHTAASQVISSTYSDTDDSKMTRRECNAVEEQLAGYYRRAHNPESEHPALSSQCQPQWQCWVQENRSPKFWYAVREFYDGMPCMAGNVQGLCSTYRTKEVVLHQRGCDAQGTPVYYQNAELIRTGVFCKP